jgi:acetyl esterase/lipase
MTMPAADAALVERRRSIEEALAAQTIEPATRIGDPAVPGVETVLVEPLERRTDAVLLHFHGGGLRVGSVRGYTRFFSRLAAAAGARVLGVDYPLAPEQQHPAALEEGIRAFHWLADRGEAIIISGDSAGSALAGGVALEVGGAHSAQHIATILLSPWVDLTITNDSYRDNADSDTTFSAVAARAAAALYVGSADPADPRVSPAFGDWSGQSPLLVEASTAEVLRDDARALVLAAVSAGVAVWFREVPDQPHNWQIAGPPITEARLSLQHVGDFVSTIASRHDVA